MDCVAACLKHLALDYELGCGVFLFGNFKQLYKILGLFFLLRFGFKFLFSDWSSRCNWKLKYGFCSKNVLQGKSSKVDPWIDEMEEREKLIADVNLNTDEEHLTEDDEREWVEEDGEYDVSTLRKLLRTERRKVDAGRGELERERAASASAAEESMAMVVRLQNEKSLIEMESSQFRRLAEEKQIHDQQVIRSLQWLVWRQQLKLCRKKLKENEYEDESECCFNGNILDALENVLYSSRDAANN